MTYPCWARRCTRRSKVFGEALTLAPRQSVLDAEEWLCNPDAADLKAELLRLQVQRVDWDIREFWGNVRELFVERLSPEL